MRPRTETQAKELCDEDEFRTDRAELLQQFQAQPIPVEHPVMPQLRRLFGDHTYFLDGKGLNIVEPVNEEQDGDRRAVVVKFSPIGTIGPRRMVLSPTRRK